MAQNKIRMPSTQGGLVRYSDETSSKFQIRPEYLVGVILALCAAVIALQVFF